MQNLNKRELAMLWRVMDEGPNSPALSAVRKYAAKGINRKMIL